MGSMCVTLPTPVAYRQGSKLRPLGEARVNEEVDERSFGTKKILYSQTHK